VQPAGAGVRLPRRCRSAWETALRVYEGVPKPSADEAASGGAIKTSCRRLIACAKWHWHTLSTHPLVAVLVSRRNPYGRLLRHATAAAIAGALERSIMRQTGPRSVQMVRRYIRDATCYSAGKLDL
jgi:hypothetical protein